MAQEQRPGPTGWGAAATGFVEGAVVCLVIATLVRFLAAGTAVLNEWPKLLAFSLGTGIVFAIGRGVAGRLGGAVVGGVVGIVAGGWVAAVLPAWNLTYTVAETARPDKQHALAGPGLDGKRIDVADYRGKVVLVDFWATWCPPCVGELPHVKATYEKHHDAGFEVIAVSLDNDRRKLEEFVKKQELPWPQIFFDNEDGKPAVNPLAKEHGVRGIPATFLLDREGRVAATDLRGQELENEVDRLIAGGERKEVIPLTMYLCMAAGAFGLAWAAALAQRRGAATPSPSDPAGQRA